MSFKSPFQSKTESAMQDAETEVATSTALARQNLGGARTGLGDLETTTLAPLAQVTEKFEQVARQLSDMVMTTANEITRSPAGRPFMPLVEQLADAARASLTAVHELRRASNDGRSRVHDLTALVEESQAALHRLGPAITALSSAAAQATRTHAPAVEVVERTGAFATDKAARVAELTEQVLQLQKQRPSGPKN
jgi:methyl-accepting chemotaxis protein